VDDQKNRPAPTILVVEDEILLRDLVCDHLREAGWNVLEADSGEDALTLLEGPRQIDVVFTDIRLNGTLNGWDVGEACRRKVADFPVIYATGFTVEPPRKVAGSIFFDKPYRPEQIHDACERLFAEKKLR
jgi:CheY-like chemotaxis protein